MSRPLLSISLVLALAFAAGCSGDDEPDQTTTRKVATQRGGDITLRGARSNSGPWVRSLALEHGEDGVPVSFYVCAAWDEARAPDDCSAAPGAELPQGTILRLEQRPVGTALKNPDSPGWGTVGTSERAELHVPLSDFVSGLKVRTATYRVTLRRLEGGPALATSDTFAVTWAG